MHDLLFVFLFSSVPHGIRALGSRNPRTPTAFASPLGSRRLLPPATVLRLGSATPFFFFVAPSSKICRAVCCPRNFSPWNLSPSTVCRVRGICRHHHHLSRRLRKSVAPSTVRGIFSPWNLSPSTICRVRGICRHHHHHLAEFLGRRLWEICRVHFSAEFPSPSRRHVHFSGNLLSAEFPFSGNIFCLRNLHPTEFLLLLHPKFPAPNPT